MEAEVRLKVASEFEADLKKMEEIHLAAVKKWVTQYSKIERQ